ncbi:hypothetical protein PYCCODRAFT_1378950 [Trametes coccinea BRFM310]|uniref:Uncharacterized protein n=1 Tax=Trametes coccinea (strain BRFM310) TaxID=1353009 RepID=A0A1Y2I9J4_TRAC3|nr:hypothetical protein PYCCODRAFT_1378950 [Trametes coccinea BRFM310]
MNRPDRHSPFDLTLVPTAEEVKNYDRRRDGHCCTTDRFRPDLNGTPASEWNKSCITVFAQSFVDSDEYECGDIPAIKKMFQTHLRHLARKYRRDISGEENKKRLRKQANRDERKRNLYNRRYTAALSYTALKPHVAMLERLGVNGMSSDESCVENDVVHYEILVKRWRHPALTSWLRTFDAVYRKLRFSETNRTTRGAPVHWRQVTTRVDNSRAAVHGLPKNAYNPDWLTTLQDMDLEDLAMEEDAYPFTHPPEVMMYVSSRCPTHFILKSVCVVFTRHRAPLWEC